MLLEHLPKPVESFSELGAGEKLEQCQCIPDKASSAITEAVKAMLRLRQEEEGGCAELPSSLSES